MKKYTQYIKEAVSSQYVYLDDGRGGVGFNTNKYPERNSSGLYKGSISSLNQKIKEYTESIYKPFGFVRASNIDIKLDDGTVINSEYISKMVNNYTIFKSFIRENKIENEETFYSLIESKLFDVYHYKGSFFKKHSLSILINTTRKGNVNEINSLDVFQKFASEGGRKILIEKPTISEDINGIDGKFIINGKYYTIQVKPFTEVKEENQKFYAKSSGSLSLGVDYLILYKGDKYIMLRNPNSNMITIEGSNFVYNSKNVIKK